MNVGVIGLWHLGEIVSLCLASLGHKVVGYDSDPKPVAELTQGSLVIEEPGIKEFLISGLQEKTLAFELLAPKRMERHGVVIIAYDTPLDEDGRPKTEVIIETAKRIAKNLRSGALLLIMSQVPVGTCRAIEAAVAEVRGKTDILIAYSPENLQLGKAREAFLSPARIIIGAESPEAFEKTEQLFQGIPGERLHMNLPSAEMVKHALNAFLATTISFIHNIGDLCEATGADVLQIAKALRSDPRIGARAYLDVNFGFSGGTLMRDLAALSTIGAEQHTPIPVIEAVAETNKKRLEKAFTLLERQGFRELKNTPLAILGVTYKPGTPTLRASLAIELMRRLKAQGAILRASDPTASPDEVKAATGAVFSRDPYEAAKGASVALLLTDWPEYRNLDLLKLKAAMHPPFGFIDSMNFLAPRLQEFQNLGFQYAGVGRGSHSL